MAYESFYRYILKNKYGNFEICKGSEKFGTYHTIEDALYERDRLIKVDWDMDASLHLPETINGYIHIDLPPFDHSPTYIYKDEECWVVRDKGKNQKYRGTYYTEEEAKKVALIYNANISHKNPYFKIIKNIDGKNIYFGRFKTYEEAEEKLNELIKNGWKK